MVAIPEADNLNGVDSKADSYKWIYFNEILIIKIKT